jgi:predicted metal-dependent peptidase
MKFRKNIQNLYSEQGFSVYADFGARKIIYVMDVLSLSLMRSSILYRNPGVPLKQNSMSGI